MYVPEPRELVQTVDDEFGFATGRVDTWGEHYEIDLGDRRVLLHYEDLREVDR